MGFFKAAGVNRKLFLILLVAGVLAYIGLIPYLMSLTVSSKGRLPPVPFPVLISAMIVQAIVLFSIVIFAGLFLGKKVGLGAYVLEAWLNSEIVKERFKSILKISVFLGVLVGISLFFLDRVAFAFFIEPITSFQAKPPLWQRILVSFYGGIGEEIVMRLFLMTVIVWISSKIQKTQTGLPTKLGIWIAIILISVVFGLGHLPMTAKFQQITILVVFRAIILNGIAGVVFGWLYWKKGLESAMISHFSADIILHVILPLF
ncbi:MAG: CPBP family intramembrane metalloprotease [Sedimentisphaerales bacterium]|nr:CPBP family intramembrane metalloprotease [Sedimentisphaerales bacterium]